MSPDNHPNQVTTGYHSYRYLAVAKMRPKEVMQMLDNWRWP